MPSLLDLPPDLIQQFFSCLPLEKVIELTNSCKELHQPHYVCRTMKERLVRAYTEERYDTEWIEDLETNMDGFHMLRCGNTIYVLETRMGVVVKVYPDNGNVCMGECCVPDLQSLDAVSFMDKDWLVIKRNRVNI